MDRPNISITGTLVGLDSESYSTANPNEYEFYYRRGVNYYFRNQFMKARITSEEKIPIVRGAKVILPAYK